MNTALAFSGGKDSWACLWLNEHRMGDIYVVWVNTGKNFPEVLKTIEKAKAMCPNWIEVRTDRDAQNDREGLPAQIVPIDWTPLGQKMSGRIGVKIQSYLGCCYENISGPLNEKIKQLGISEVISGKRKDDNHKPPIEDGQEVDGVVHRHPIADWSASQVLSFCAEHMEIPEHFKFAHSSMDCFDCTAYREEVKDRIEFMKEQHPELFDAYKRRADAVDGAIREAMEVVYA